jgi:group I intron endonuclease
MIAYIYKITNPKGKIYIGSTINLKDRIYRYKSNRIKYQVKIQRSIYKYGWDAHSFEIIKECDSDKRYYYEFYYGSLYDVISDKGLNCKLPKINDTYQSMSQETKIKIGLAHKGKKLSEEQKKQISIRSKNWHKNNDHPMSGAIPWNKGKSVFKCDKNPMYGVRRDTDWKAKHSERMKLLNPRGENHFKSKIVFDFINGIYYTNVKEACDLLSIKYSTLKTILRKNRPNKYNLKYA